MLGLFIASVWWSIRSGTSHEEIPHDTPGVGVSVLWIALGITLLTSGGWLLVKGAVALAGAAGISDTLIGLTIVAAGTSAPELITSLLAARRGQHAIAVANIVGSNTFNILGILGLTGLFGALPVAASMVRVDLWVMLAFALALPLAWGLRRGRIGRGGAALLLSGYLIYLGWLIADAQQH
jgi:cation:H+ antiporter